MRSNTPGLVTLTYHNAGHFVAFASGHLLRYLGAAQVAMIEPQTEQEISAELRDVNPEDFEGYEFCNYDEDVETFRSCMTWGWAQIKGLKI